MLVLENVCVSYGRLGAVRNVSFEVESGKTVAVLGPNGAGKTSLGRAVIGLIPHEGKVILNGKDVSKSRADLRCKSGISYVPSSARVFPSLSVKQNIEIGAKNFGKAWSFVCEQFPILSEKAHQSAGQLSGGQQQLLSIARALSTEPSFLVLDEPSAGLAPVVIEEVFLAMQRLSETSIGVLLLEQNAALGLELAQECVVLSTGSIRLKGPASELKGSQVIEDLYMHAGKE
jgi:branched-chain amino acid transport system ATP-binding protein